MTTAIRSYKSLANFANNGKQPTRYSRSYGPPMHFEYSFSEYIFASLLLFFATLIILKGHLIWQWLTHQLTVISREAAVNARNVTLKNLVVSLTSAKGMTPVSNLTNAANTTRSLDVDAEKPIDYVWALMILIILLSPTWLHALYRVWNFVKAVYKEPFDYYHEWKFKLDSSTITRLTQTTHFSAEELQMWNRAFRKDCPSGRLTIDGVENALGGNFPEGNATAYAALKFRQWDVQRRGFVDFEGFISYLSTSVYGSVREQADILFDLYDVDGDGLVSECDMLDVVTAVYEMLGPNVDLREGETTPRQRVEKIFAGYDDGCDRKLSKEGFRAKFDRITAYPVGNIV